MEIDSCYETNSPACCYEAEQFELKELNEADTKATGSAPTALLQLVQAFDKERGEVLQINFTNKTVVNHTGSETPLINETTLIFKSQNEEKEIAIYAAPDIIKHLDGVCFEKMEQSQLLAWLFKLALAHGHEHQKIAGADSEFKKKTAVLLRVEIKDNANSKWWMFWSGVGVVAAGAGLIGGIAMAQVSAQHAQNALQFGQLGQSMSSPLSTYCQTDDQTIQEEARHRQQMVGGDRQNQEQHGSSAEQTQESLRQSLQQVIEKKGQFVGQLFH